MTGLIFNLQRFSLHDGPGIRTTVFLKGCNARCAWCHNPESMAAEPQISVNLAQCTGCGECGRVCPRGAHVFDDATRRLDMANCNACGACADACPLGLITRIGQRVTPGEILATLLRDKPYYDRSGGGVTFSGGEPTLQFDFLVAMLGLCHKHGLHTVLETNGLVAPARLDALAPLVDLFLLDFKLSDDALHRHYTHFSNAAPLAALARLNQLQKPVILRAPVIPGVSDTPEHFATLRRLKSEHPVVQRVDLMPYHAIGNAKWSNLGLVCPLPETQPPSEETRQRWREMLA